MRLSKIGPNGDGLAVGRNCIVQLPLGCVYKADIGMRLGQLRINCDSHMDYRAGVNSLR